MDKDYFNTIRFKKNIAIVGSSISLLKKKDGKKIDKFQEIVRFNRSVTINFESHVGSKTTTRVINNSVFCCAPTNNSKWKLDQYFAKNISNKKIVVISPWRIKKIHKKKHILKKNIYFFYDSFLLNKFIFIFFFNHPKIFTKLIKILIFRNKYLSAGIFFILLCVINNIIPTIFGFDPNEDMTKRSHYWEDIRDVKTSNDHNFFAEKIILNYLHKHKLVKLVT